MHIDTEGGEVTVGFLIDAPAVMFALLLVLHIGFTGIAVQAGESTVSQLAQRFTNQTGRVADAQQWEADAWARSCDVLTGFGGLGAEIDAASSQCGGAGAGWVTVVDVEVSPTAGTECRGVSAKIDFELDTVVTGLPKNTVTVSTCAPIREFAG